MSAGIDLSWNKKRRLLFVCLVVFRDSNIAFKAYKFLADAIMERRLHYRRLTSKKKKILLSAVESAINSRIGISKDNIFVFKIIIHRNTNILSKYSWLEKAVANIILMVRRYRNYPHQVIMGSDLERGSYSFARNLQRRLYDKILVYVDDKSPEVCVADAIVNYARVRGVLPTKSHHC
ncbi:MAG: hypothetical protein Q6363_009955 [Candidatus Njordarchaeota archaeon]